MLNQGQGTYPQLAGSFYNSAQMMPHDNGRTAQQVPTFFGGLQNMMSASAAMTNYQGMPLNQSILGTQALAHHQYGQGLANTIGGLGTGIGVAGLVGGLGTFAAGKLGAAPTGLLTRGLGIAGGLPMAIAGAGVMATMHVYNKRMKDIEDMRNAMEGSRLGYGLADPITGGLTNQAALSLSRQMEYSAAGSGFRDGNDLKKVMGQASGLGMLNGMQSLGEVTKKVTDLAKASREIVMLGEGITMSDAMQLQKLTQDMGISTTKFRGMNIGKNLVMAARAAGMSMDEAAQVGGQGAMTFQQLGLGAASGMNAAFFSNIAAKGLTGVGAFSQRQLAAMGGEQGIAQNLLMGQASTMGRLSDTLVMGAVKLGGDGQFRIDREMLDRYVRGDISLKEMQQRGKDIGKGMRKDQRAKLLESLNFAMPELKEQASDMLNSEEMMAIQGREILNLRKKTGLSMKRAAQVYFGDTAQAETFLGYAQNYRATRAEQDRQRRIADNEQMLKYAGMAKSSSMMAGVGRGIVHGFEAAGDVLMSIPTALGEGLAENVQRYQDSRNRGLKTILGIGDSYAGVGIDTSSTIYGGSNKGAEKFLAYDLNLSRPTKGKVGGIYSNYSDLASVYLTGDKADPAAFMREAGLKSGLNEFLGGGLGQRLTEYREGDYSMFRKLGDFLGIEGTNTMQIRDLQEAASIADDAVQMGRLIQGNNKFSYGNKDQRSAFRTALNHLRDVSVQAAEGGGSGDYGGVNSADIRVSTLRSKLSGYDRATQDAAIAQAYRFAKSAGGQFSIGFNKMLDATAGVAGMLQLGESSVQEKLDGIRLESGGFIESKGLSQALAQSGMSDKDVQQLVSGIVENRDAFVQDGSGVDSTQGILRKIGISPHRYRNNMGGVRKVIDALLQAQIKTTNSKGKEVTLGLKEAFAQGTNLTLGKGAVRSSVNADTLRRLDALDAEIETNLGDGGGNLRTDLLAGLTEADMESPEAIQRAKEYLAQEEGVLTRSSIGTRARHMRNAEAKKVAQELEDSQKTLNALYREDKRSVFIAGSYRHNDFLRRADEADKRHAALTKRSRELEQAKVGSRSATYKQFEEQARAALIEEHSAGKTGEEVVTSANQKRRTLLSRSGTLSEALQDLAERQIDAKGLTGKEKEKALADRKSAYSKLMSGITGTKLETEFRAARSELRGVTDPQQRRQKELELMQKIIEKARSQGIENIPGAEKAKSLPDILSEIAGGITEFKKTMTHIATLTAQGGTMQIHGSVQGTSPAPASTGKEG